MAQKKPLHVGDRVGYAANFLRSIACFSGELPHARGVIKELEDLGSLVLAVIEWDRPGVPTKVNVNNLARVGSAAMYAS
jgi:hypothetical protein